MFNSKETLKANDPAKPEKKTHCGARMQLQHVETRQKHSPTKEPHHRQQSRGSTLAKNQEVKQEHRK